jgi:anti-sigma factor RsiW
MHASLSELLELRDGASLPEVAAHLAGCPTCAAELERLRDVRDALRALPADPPDRDLWPAVLAGARAQASRRRWRRVGWAAAVLAAVVTVVAGVRGTVETIREARAAREAHALMAESEQLEVQLRSLQRRDRVMSGLEANMVAELEDRLAVVDARLASAPRGDTSDEQTIDLWGERVRLLDALVDVHRTRAAYAGL